MTVTVTFTAAVLFLLCGIFHVVAILDKRSPAFNWTSLAWACLGFGLAAAAYGGGK